jgi:hypothetical protein
MLTLYTLKIGLVVFWALWLSVVFITNLFDGLKGLRVLPQDWKLASGKYDAIRRATEYFSPPAWVNRLLFLGVLVWQGLIVLLFWTAAFTPVDNGALDRAGSAAFTLSLGLWAVFLLADEVLKYYRGERDHMLIFLTQLVSLLTFLLLPS